MTVAEYAAWWRRHKGRGDSAPADDDTAAIEPPGRGSPAPLPLLYLKDWHLAAEYPRYGAYSCPPHFSEDWLNEWHDAARRGRQEGGEEEEQQQGGGGCVATSDYRFVYLGPAVSRESRALLLPFPPLTPPPPPHTHHPPPTRRAAPPPSTPTCCVATAGA